VTRRRALDRARVSRVRLHSVGPWPVVILGGTLVFLLLGALALVWMPDDGWFHLGIFVWELLFVPGALAVTFAAMSIAASYRSVTVGTDGILLVDRRGRQSFHRHAEVDELSFGLAGPNAVLRLRIAERALVLPCFGWLAHASAEARARAREEVATAVAEIRAIGVEAGSSDAFLADDPATLELLDVPAQLEGDRVYRGSAVTREAVWAILEDPTAPPQARVRVAETLRVSMGEAPRLRIAADEAASPEVRVVLLRAERRALAIDDEP